MTLPTPNHEAIAQIAGVARSTVSRALSGDTRIAEETRTRINKIASELNYHPHLNLGAQLMAAHRTGRPVQLSTLGFMWPIEADDAPYRSFSMTLLSGAIEACRDENQGLLIVNLNWEQSKLFSSLAQLDGLILQSPSPKVLDPAKQLGKPIVTIQSNYPGIADVGIDNHAAVEMAFRHLYEQGHRKIGWLSPSLSPNPELRWTAYCQCLRDAGLPYCSDYVITETQARMAEEAEVAIRKLWSRAERPTAIIVYNDVMALRVLRTAREMGLRVPEDLSLVSIDDIPEASQSQPTLTTVAIGIEGLGRHAAQLLAEFVRTGTYRAENIHLKNFALKERGTVKSIAITR